MKKTYLIRDLLLKEKKDILLLALMMTVAILLINYAVAVYLSEISAYRKADELLNFGAKKTGLFSDRDEDNAEQVMLEHYDNKRIAELDEVAAAGEYITNYFCDIKEFADIQKGHAKYNQNCEGGFYETVYADPCVLDMFDIRISDGISFDEAEKIIEDDDHTDLVYLGSGYESIELGKKYEYDEFDQKRYMIVAGRLADQKILDPSAVMNIGQGINSPALDSEYCILRLSSRASTNTFMIAASDGHDFEEAKNAVKRYGLEKNKKMIGQSIDQTFISNQKESYNYIKGLVRVIGVIIVSAFITMICMMYVSSHKVRYTYGILLTQGFDTLFIKKALISKYIITALLSMPVFGIIFHRIIAYLYRTDISTDIFLYCLSLAVLFEVLTLTVSYVISVNTLFKKSPAMMLGGAYDQT